VTTYKGIKEGRTISLVGRPPGEFLTPIVDVVLGKRWLTPLRAT